MPDTIRTPFLALAFALAASACAPATGNFTYEMPKFGATLKGPNFEYIRFGVVGEASIPTHVQTMIDRFEVALVNEALTKIYAQVGVAGQPIALVNVVVDVSKKVVISQSLTSTNTSTSDDYLVIRADVVRFTHPNEVAASPASSAAAHAPTSSGLRMYEPGEATTREIAQMVSAKLGARETL